MLDKSKLAFRGILVSHMTIMIAVVIIGLITSTFAWYSSYNATTHLIEERLKNESAFLENALQKRIKTYEEILRGGAALIYVKNQQISDSDWEKYVSTFDISSRYPGLRGIGYVKYSPSSSANNSPESSSIVYFEPKNTEEPPIGSDMFLDPIKRQAMILSRDTGQPALSHSVNIPRTSGKANDTFELIDFVPVYCHIGHNTAQDRRSMLTGYIYAPISIKELIESIVGKEISKDSIMTVTDKLPNNKQRVVFGSIMRSGVLPLPVTKTAVHLDTLSLHVNMYPYLSLLSHSEQNRAMVVFICGLMMTAMLTMLLEYIMRNRLRSLEYQRQKEITKAKDELLSLASHQLRTPATGVKQYLGIMLDDTSSKLTEEQRNLIERANVSNERQIEIINQILHVTRIENSRITPNKKPVNLSGMIREIVDEQREVIKKRQQKIIIKLPQRKVMAQVDQQYFRMAIENLITNASKYTREHGKIIVSVSSNQGTVVIRVEDSGVGIDEKDFPKLFEKFSRVHNELSIKAGGSGFGLYLTMKIVSMHGGEIEVESIPGQGSIFSVIIPTESLL